MNEAVQGSKVLTLLQDTCHRHWTYKRTTLQAMPKKIWTSPYKTQAKDNQQISLGFLTNFLRCSMRMTLIKRIARHSNLSIMLAMFDQWHVHSECSMVEHFCNWTLWCHVFHYQWYCLLLNEAYCILGCHTL